MVSSGAAKRSSSAHALMETDRMSESGPNLRRTMRSRADPQYPNGDVSSRPRLRGEMETSPFIIPPSKLTNVLRRQNSDSRTKEQSRQTGLRRSPSRQGDVNASSSDFRTQSNPSLSMNSDGRLPSQERLDKPALMGLSNHVEMVSLFVMSNFSPSFFPTARQ